MPWKRVQVDEERWHFILQCAIDGAALTLVSGQEWESGASDPPKGEALAHELWTLRQDFEFSLTLPSTHSGTRGSPTDSTKRCALHSTSAKYSAAGTSIPISRQKY
jgi:hypothetical protein